MRSVGLAIWLLFAGVLSAQEVPPAKPESVGMSAEQLAKLDLAVNGLIAKNRIAGAVILVAKGGKVVHFEAYGKRDLDTGEPMKRDTVMRFYSMTKPITSVAAMTLLEQGKFQLDDPVEKYLPELKGLKVYVSGEGDDLTLEPANRPMTVRDLMRHTSGLTYGFFGDTPVDQLYRENGILGQGRSLQGTVAKLGEIPLAYQPGSKYVYSASTDVLGRLVEVLSGKPLDAYFREAIFEPLGMKDTGFFAREDQQDRFASVHGRGEDGQLRVSEPTTGSRFLRDPKLLSGGGGLVSTARDYARFCQMLLNGGELDGKRILKAETVAEMTRNQLPEGVDMGRPGVGFGLGFSVNTKSGRIGEYGWGGAASTHFWISPKDDLYVVALQQFQPYQGTLENAVKPLVYAAIEEE